MADRVDKHTRSRIMSAVRRQNTTPELRVRKYLHQTGLRYTLHNEKLPGRPDIIFPRHKTVVFVHGCFWHRHHGCRLATTPSTNQAFWDAKFSKNIARDLEQKDALIKMGWKVEIIWECESKDELALDELFWRIVSPK